MPKGPDQRAEEGTLLLEVLASAERWHDLLGYYREACAEDELEHLKASVGELVRWRRGRGLRSYCGMVEAPRVPGHASGTREERRRFRVVGDRADPGGGGLTEAMKNSWEQRLLEERYPTGSLASIDHHVGMVISGVGPAWVTQDEVRRELAVHWLGNQVAVLPWWRRPAFWWRVWRGLPPSGKGG